MAGNVHYSPMGLYDMVQYIKPFLECFVIFDG